ncbi:glycosyltransferase family 9 protein [candidate division KSB1 bacterium]|nr:glycosyltransferase family 9 protein [candidate division KSB1 bacterium]
MEYALKLEFKNIAVLSVSGIGNTIFAVPMLRLLRKQYPNAHIVLFVRFKAARDLFQACPYVDEIIVVDYAILKTLKERIQFVLDIRQRKFDLCIIPFPSEKRDKNIFSFLTGAPVRISNSYVIDRITDLGFLQTKRIPVDVTIHDLDQNLRILEELGIDTSNADRTLQVWVSDEDKAFAKKYLQEKLGADNLNKKLIVGFHAGSSEEFGMTYKRWAPENFARLGDMILEKYDAEILLFGGPEEKELKQAIAKSMKRTPHIIEKTSLPKDAAIMDYCHLFVSNDSGNMNLALAVGVKTIGLFGPVDSVRADLKSEQHRIIQSPAHCSPCWGLANITEPLICTQPEVICMKKIAYDSVQKIVDEYLLSITVADETQNEKRVA